MNAIKARLTPALRRTAHLTGISSWIARRRRVLRIVMLHGVGDAELSAAELAATLRWLRREFHVVGLDALVERVRTLRGQPQHEVVLTFDDGLRNNLTVAYPLLKELGLPATFYVCPGLIDRGQWLWNLEVRARLRTLSLGARAELAQELGVQDSDEEGVVAWMKRLKNPERAAVEHTLRSVTPTYRPSATDRTRYDLMSWDELASLDPALITIGSHSVDHALATACTDDELRYQITESRAWLERRLGRAVDHFCYPDGAFNEDAARLVRATYASAVTVLQGVVRPGDDPHTLRRIPMAGDVATLAWRMHRPTS